MAESQKEKLMRTLGCTEEEALDIIASDKAIDQGKRVEFDLDPEREKMAKKMANAGTKKPTVYNFDTKDRKRKADEDKAKLIAILAESLEQVEIIPTVTNPEREMEFTYNGRKFKLTLSAPRK